MGMWNEFFLNIRSLANSLRRIMISEVPTIGKCFNGLNECFYTFPDSYRSGRN